MEYRLYQGDCLEVMPTLPPQSADMILVDTPYGQTSNGWDTALDLAAMWEQSQRLIKPHGAIVHFATQPYTSMLVMSHPKGYKHKWTWDKGLAGNFAVTQYMPLSIDEDILVFTASGERVNYHPIMVPRFKTRTVGGNVVAGQGFGGIQLKQRISAEAFPVTILHYPNTDRVASLHPSQKPVDLLVYLVKTYTNPGDTVLDFCMGSGSTGRAAAETGRNFVGIELDGDYHRIATERIEAAYRRASGLPKLGKPTDTADLPLFA